MLRRDLKCGVVANGFARAYCDECQHDLVIAYSCKCRGVCASCNTRRMAETAAHLVDHVFPLVPVRQWVLAVPKRLRYVLQCVGNGRCTPVSRRWLPRVRGISLAWY